MNRKGTRRIHLTTVLALVFFSFFALTARSSVHASNNISVGLNVSYGGHPWLIIPMLELGITRKQVGFFYRGLQLASGDASLSLHMYALRLYIPSSRLSLWGDVGLSFFDLHMLRQLSVDFAGVTGAVGMDYYWGKRKRWIISIERRHVYMKHQGYDGHIFLEHDFWGGGLKYRF